MQSKGLEVEKRNRIRVERPADLHVESGDEHGWAVSYADLLMVILSFFVIFFSQNQDAKSNIIKQIVSDYKDGESSGSPQNDGDGTGYAQSTGAYTESHQLTQASKAGTSEELKSHLETLAEKLKDLKITSYAKNDSIVFQFPHNMYGKNDYTLDPKDKESVAYIVDRLNPYVDKIDMVFVGHSDDRPVRGTRGQMVYKNNFDLSSLRANYALRYALELGVPASRLFTYGVGENKRNSRSLSLLIRPKGETL